MKRLTLAVVFMLSGCMSTATRNAQPVHIGDNHYELKTTEEKATLYPRLEAFCRSKGGAFREYSYRDDKLEKEFVCDKPVIGYRSSQDVDVYIHPPPLLQ